MKTCYYCGSVATTKEHVPPKCLFPEKKDIGNNYRDNLITVPSCDLHNGKKSKDDEFLMVSLAGIFGNNSIGYAHKFGKVNRAIKRSSSRLLNKVFLKKKTYTVPVGKNHFYEVILGTPDYERLIKCFDHIARGIYYHHYGEQFDGLIRVQLGYLNYQEGNSKEFNDCVKFKAESELTNVKKYGENQKIFFYQIVPPDEKGISLLSFVFYGGITVYVSLGKDIYERPFNFGMFLIEKGITTVINVGEKQFVFNKNSSKGLAVERSTKH